MFLQCLLHFTESFQNTFLSNVIQWTNSVKGRVFLLYNSKSLTISACDTCVCISGDYSMLMFKSFALRICFCFFLFVLFCFFEKFGFHSMQGWTATNEPLYLRKARDWGGIYMVTHFHGITRSFCQKFKLRNAVLYRNILQCMEFW